MEDAPTYSYRSLGVQQIRLLTLISSREGDSLKATLKAHSLSSLPPYETISYVWGSERKTNSIEIRTHKQEVRDNTAFQRFHLTQNAYSALLNMRRDDRSRVLWIDAICIDQDNIEERNVQVSFMADIYRSANANLIHLTTNHNLADRILCMIREVDANIRAVTNDYKSFVQTVRDSATGDLRYATRHNAMRIDEQTVLQMLSLPWFRRLWVVQEARNARTNICYLGPSQILLITLLRVVCWLDHTNCLRNVTMLEARAGRRCMLEMFDLTDREYGRFVGQHLHFDHLLILAQNYEKTNPKDSIYALLGMLPKSVHRLTPNYRLSLSWILQEATHRVIELNKDLSILRFVHHRHHEGLGSCPHDIRTWVRRADLQYRNDLDPRPFQDLFNATQGLDSPTIVPAPNGRLLVRGDAIDKVEKLTPVCTLEITQTSEAFEKWLLDSLTQLGIYQQDSEANEPSNFYAIANALTAERSARGGRVRKEDMANVVEYVQALLAQRSGRHVELNAIQNLCDFGDLRNRRLCLTSNKRYGLVSQIAQPNDEIVILRGSKYPCLLRICGTKTPEKQAEYHFVGTAYISGIMYGEALPGRLALYCDEEEFTLV